MIDFGATIHLLAMESSGGTLVTNILQDLGARDVAHYNNPQKFQPELIVYRDPRDVCVSMAGRVWPDLWHSDPKQAVREMLVSMFPKRMPQWISIMQNWGTRVPSLRYEWFAFDLPGLTQCLASMSGNPLSVRESWAIASKWSIHKANEIAAKFTNFSEVDPETGYHGLHCITSGRIGVWREVMDDETCRLACRTLKPLLDVFRYHIPPEYAP